MTKRWYILLLLIVVCILLAIPQLARTPLQVNNSYNEGWNAYHTQDLLQGKPLYTSGLTTNNYPPLSFFITAGIANIFHIDPLFAGRYINVISLVFIIALIILITKELTRKLYESLFAGVFCLGLLLIIKDLYIGINDPQLLSLAILLLGLYAYVKRFKYSLLIAAIFFSLALFTKNNLIALPIVIGLDLFFQSKKKFISYAGYMLFFGIILFSFSQFLAHGQFLHELVLSREYSLLRIFYFNAPILIKIIIPILLGIFVWIVVPWKQKLIPNWFILSFFIGLFFSGGSGVDANIFFDMFISLSIVLGMYLQSLKNPSVYAAVVLVLTVNIAIFFPMKLMQHTYLTDIQKEQKDILFDAQLIARQKSPVICENLILCYLAKQPFVYDAFYTKQLIVTGKVKQSDIISTIKRHQYSMIEIEYKTDRFPKDVLTAIQQNYKIVRRDSIGIFYAPL